MKARFTRQCAALCVVLLPILCLGVGESQAAADTQSAHEYVAPEKTGDGWETASLATENVNTNLIKDLIERVDNDSYTNISSLIIVKNGKLIVEEYFPRQGLLGDQRQRALKRVSPLQLYSATKSVTSILFRDGQIHAALLIVCLFK